MANVTTTKTACGVFITIWAYAFWPTLSSFGLPNLLIIPLSLLAMFSVRGELRKASFKGNIYGLLLVALVSVLWLFAAITKLVLIQQIFMISMIPCFFLATCGLKVTKILTFPLISLFLLLPIGQLPHSVENANLYLILGATYSFLLSKSLIKRIIITSSTFIFTKGLLFMPAIHPAYGLLLSAFLGWKLRDRKTTTIQSDNIDWHTNHYTNNSAKVNIPTALIMLQLLFLPFAANKLQATANYIVSPEYSQSTEQVALYIDDINKINNQKDYLYDSSIWQPVNTKKLKINLNHKKIMVTETIVTYKSYSKVIWTVNYINGHLTNNKFKTKVLQNLYALTPNGAQAKVINLVTDGETDLSIARSRLEGYIQTL